MAGTGNFARRPATRPAAPPVWRVLDETNELLARNGLPPIALLDSTKTDQDTANPTFVGVAADREYVIKVVIREGTPPTQQRLAAELVRQWTSVPAPAQLCAQDGPARLPLLVMDRAPGVQLVQALSEWSADERRAVCCKWGRYLALWHGADIAELRRERRFALAFHRDLSAIDDERVRAYLLARSPSLDEPALPGLGKADEDVRDALVERRPAPRVSALIDFEKVGLYDNAATLSAIYLRLQLLGVPELWASFAGGYEAARGVRFARTPQAEYYLMRRAAVAARQSDRAKAVVTQLIEGDVLPFG